MNYPSITPMVSPTRTPDPPERSFWDEVKYGISSIPGDLASLAVNYKNGIDSILGSPEFSYISPAASAIYRFGPQVAQRLGLDGSKPLPYLDELIGNAIQGIGDDLSGGSSPGSTPGGAPSPGYFPNPSAQQIDYLYADLSKYYGMDRETAYNEAMANTAYQRAVADMQQAGLNPASLFSASRASTAGSGFAHGSASGGYSSGRRVSDGNSIPGWMYYGVSALAQAIGTYATKSYTGGFVASQVAQNFMKAANGFHA